jgi:acyl-CoA reductase-like NAD-dependent aldehyde dehydrogenase
MNTTFSPSLRTPHPDELLIGGRWQAPRSTARVAVINSSSGAVIASLAAPSVLDADLAVQAAREAFDHGGWPDLPVAERVAHVRRLVDEVEARLPELNVAWTAECGATVAFREGMNGFLARAAWNDFLEIAQTLPFSELRETKDFGTVELRREPAGVVVNVLTYNGPVAHIGLKVIPALLAGCTVVVKPAPETQLVARLLGEAIEAAGLPPGVMSLLAGDSEVSKALVGHPGVDIVNFTGGTEIGKQVMASCASRLAKCTLELGGKSAALIDEDVPLDTVLPQLVPGMLMFQGQLCTALTRVLVPRSRAGEVTDALVDAFRAQRVGDPQEASTDWGPLAVERARVRVERAVDSAVHEGAKVVAGGARPAGFDRGWYYEPTLLTEVSNRMAVAQDEIFGPVYCLIEYDDIDDAVGIANDSRFGLAGSVFTDDQVLALDVSRRVRTGTFAINAAGAACTQPFGGMKQSGIGRESGPEGLFEYTEIKTTMLGTAAAAAKLEYGGVLGEDERCRPARTREGLGGDGTGTRPAPDRRGPGSLGSIGSVPFGRAHEGRDTACQVPDRRRP